MVDDAVGPRPWLVMVTGEPGSGKSSLGMHLARRLRVPHLSRDDIRWGMWATSRLWSGQIADHPQREVARQAFLEIVQLAAERGVSAVLEFIVFQDHPEQFQRLQVHADCLVVVTTCADPERRVVARERADPLLAREPVLAAATSLPLPRSSTGSSHTLERYVQVDGAGCTTTGAGCHPKRAVRPLRPRRPRGRPGRRGADRGGRVAGRPPSGAGRGEGGGGVTAV